MARTITRHTNYGRADFAAVCSDCGTRRLFSQMVEGGDGMYRCAATCGRGRDAVTLSMDIDAARRGPDLPEPGPATLYDTEADS